MTTPEIPLETRICPILSLATLARPDNSVKIVGSHTGAGKPAATRCAGPECAWWVPVSDGTGVVRSGNCSLALLPAALAQVAQQSAANAQHVAAAIRPELDLQGGPDSQGGH